MSCFLCGTVTNDLHEEWDEDDELILLCSECYYDWKAYISVADKMTEDDKDKYWYSDASERDDIREKYKDEDDDD